MNTRPWANHWQPSAPHGSAYSLRDVDLLAARPVPDVVPAGHTDDMVRRLACDAIVYGLPAALQYANLHRSVLGSEAPYNFNEWRHDRELATPGYAEFRTPNVDTLYSTAWLDLSRGPVELDVPPMGERYYTVSLFDAHSNAVNLSTRTLGPDGGRVWLTGPGWTGLVPASVRRLRVATVHVWVLMRIFVRSRADIAQVRMLQDHVGLRPTGCPSADPPLLDGLWPWPAMPADDDVLDGPTILRALDAVLRQNGYPVQEEALLAQFLRLGLARPEPLDTTAWSAEVRDAVDRGHRDARALIDAAVTARGVSAGNSCVLSSGFRPFER